MSAPVEKSPPGGGGPPVAPLASSLPEVNSSPENDLRSIYEWSAQTRRTVGAWQREESRFLWPLLCFLVLALGAGFVGGIVFALTPPGAVWNLILILAGVDYAIPIGGAILLYLFFRYRNRRLERQPEPPIGTTTPLPANLIEASLVELDRTDRALGSVHRRIWWIVFLACWLSIAVGEFSGGLIAQAYMVTSGITITSGLLSFELTYGVGLGIAAVLIAGNAVYWRRVERRLGELRKSTNARRASVAAFERTLWERI